MSEPSAVRAPEAAKLLATSPSTLAKWRMAGTGPTFAKLGRRVVVYRLDDLREWLVKNRRTSTLGPSHDA